VFDAELINPFLEAAYETFASVLETEINKSNASACMSSTTTQELSVLVNVVGSVNGHIIYGMSQATAKHIASKMMDQPVKVLNAMALSAIGELGNIITGNATTKIEEKYPKVELQPPIILNGNNMIILTESVARINVQLDSEFGNVEVGFSFFEKDINNTISIVHNVKNHTKKAV
jgi:chemotaxis protein CheX